jgi:hypothetical protein
MNNCAARNHARTSMESYNSGAESADKAGMKAASKEQW